MRRKSRMMMILWLIGSVFLWAIPATVTYQGRLVQEGKLVNGTHSLLFRLYDAGIDGTEKYTSGVQSMQVIEGLYSIDFPSTVFEQGSSLYLQVDVDNIPLLPRTKINSVAYATSVTTIDALISTANFSVNGIKEHQQVLSDGHNTFLAQLKLIEAQERNPYLNDVLATGVELMPTAVAPARWKHVFLTTEKHDANLGDPTGADALCMAEPLTGNRLSGKTYKAALYRTDTDTSGIVPYPYLQGNALSNFTQTGQTGYYTTTAKKNLSVYSLMSRKSKLDDTHSLYSGVPPYSIASGLIGLWGNVAHYGTPSRNCSNWTTNASTLNQKVALEVISDGGVVPYWNVQCNVPAVLICVEWPTNQ